MLLHLHSPEVGKSEKKKHSAFGARQTKRRSRTNTERRTSESRTNQNRARGRSLPSVSQVSWNWLKSWKRSARKARGFLSGALGRDSRMLQRRRCRAGRGGGGGGAGGGPAPCPEAFTTPSLPSTSPLTFRILHRRQARLHGALPSALRSPAPGPRMAGRLLRVDRISAGALSGDSPGPDPPNPSHPPPRGAATHLREGERHLLVQVPLHPAARALPPRSYRLSAGT